jgi:hypothetical protein
MNVEIETDAAQFSENKYVRIWDFRCSVGHQIEVKYFDKNGKI